MLKVIDVTKSYGGQDVLVDVSFVLNRSERAGLIGPNGSGKSTLLKLITGLESPDRGSIRLDSDATIGYLPQGIEELQMSVRAFLESGISEWASARLKMEEYASRMGSDATPEQIERYGELAERFEALGGYDLEHHLTVVLTGLGVESIEPDRPMGELSGGQRTRVALARLLAADPDVLVLDEPTNHLDIEALEWLEEFLSEYKGAVLLVSHDAQFLDRTVTRILEVDDKTHRVTAFSGGYSDYAEAKVQALEHQWVAWKDQQDEVGRLQRAAAHMRSLAQFRRGGKADSGDKFAKGFFSDRSLETVRRAKRIEQRLDKLLTEDKIEKPQSSWRMKLEFGEMPRGGQIVVALEDLGQEFGGRWLFQNANLVLRHGERIALVGKNGSGKTTLLRLIVGEISPTEGRVHLGAGVRLGYMPQGQDSLPPNATPLEWVRGLKALDETAARHFLHFFLFQGDEVFTSVSHLSYGERARLVLATLVLKGANCLLLDEPINHLDIPSREQFEAALDAFPGTILTAVHDRAFIDRFATGLWAPAEGTLSPFVDRDDLRRLAE